MLVSELGVVDVVPVLEYVRLLLAADADEARLLLLDVVEKLVVVRRVVVLEYLLALVRGE